MSNNNDTIKHMNEKIGVGIVTCNREETFWKSWKSLEKCSHLLDEVVVINDGKPYSANPTFYSAPQEIIQHNKNLGVGKSKNEALKFLLEKGCDHIFLIEDDIFIKDESVFQRYIDASKKSGIQHFNFSQHGLANKTSEGKPNPHNVVNYDGCNIEFYQHCVGAFSYYSRKCLEECGLMDEDYYNACEHVDHTYEIIKKGMHPPFWYFADIKNSNEYLGDDGWSIETSSICSAPDFRKNVMEADQIFVKKHGHLPMQTPTMSVQQFYQNLKEIKKNYELK
jgi:GT2 family glycosyltransferase